MKLSTAIILFVPIITLSVAQPSGAAFRRNYPESTDAETRIYGTVLQRPAGHTTSDSKDNYEARQATISFVPIVLHKQPENTVEELCRKILRINSDLEYLRRLLPVEKMRIVIRIASCELGSSHTVNHRYYDIDLHRHTRIMLDETLMDGSGSEPIVAYIPTRVFPTEPTKKCVYAYSTFAKGDYLQNDGRCAQPTLTAPDELPRVPAPIAFIITAIGAILIYRTRQNTTCLFNPICLKQKPTIKMTKRRR
ncbi:MAG: hypothetical protein ACYS8Z_14815 [Planctomycetota bacterium]|jgi:hypothetical protein